MNKKKWCISVLSMLGIVGGMILSNGTKEDTRTHMNEDIILNNSLFKVEIAYENEYLKLRPSPENKYRCRADYKLYIDEEEFETEIKLLSDVNPLKIEKIYINEDFQDSSLIIYSVDIKYYDNGRANDEIRLYNVENYVYLKKEKVYYNFRGWHDELIQILFDAGYAEYDNVKMEEITTSNREKWNNRNEIQKSE